MSFLQVKNVGKSYGQVKVLKDISIDIEKGEFICLLGPSGCGKSTLLRIIAGLEDKHDGKIIINGGFKDDPLADKIENLGMPYNGSYLLMSSPGHEKYLELSILPEGEISKSGLDKLKSDYGSSIDIKNDQNKIDIVIKLLNDKSNT